MSSEIQTGQKIAKFATLKSRKENEDELENLISQWTVRIHDYEVMYKMQAAGVPAGVVQTMADIVDNDPQLKEREFLVPIKNPVLGVFGHPTPAFKLTKTKGKVRHAPQWENIPNVYVLIFWACPMKSLLNWWGKMYLNKDLDFCNQFDHCLFPGYQLFS